MRGGAVAAATLNDIREREEAEKKNAAQSDNFDMRFDSDQNGKISASEIESSVADKRTSLTISHVRTLMGDGHKLHNLLRHMDKDGDGVVTQAEIEEAATSLLKVGPERILTMSQIEALEQIKLALLTRERTRRGYFGWYVHNTMSLFLLFE